MQLKKKQTPKNQIIRLSALALAAGSILYPAPAPAQTLSCPVSLDFGEFTACSSTQTATLTPAGSRNLTGCLSAGGAPYNPATCNVSQTFDTDGLNPIQFSITATTVPLSHSTAATSMLVDNFRCLSSSVKCTAASPLVQTTFFLSIPIGARLTVGTSQTGGSYSGTFTVNAVLQ